ncbi:MAG: hypothetical protein ACYTGX_16600 [Planctomycetota bacterium]
MTAETPDPLGELLPERPTTMPLLLRAPVAVVGITSFGMGFVGWFMPGIPGLPFHIVGLALIHVSTPAGCRAVNWMDRRMPSGARKLLRVARRKPKVEPASEGPQREA